MADESERDWLSWFNLNLRRSSLNFFPLELLSSWVRSYLALFLIALNHSSDYPALEALDNLFNQQFFLCSFSWEWFSSSEEILIFLRCVDRKVFWKSSFRKLNGYQQQHSKWREADVCLDTSTLSGYWASTRNQFNSSQTQDTHELSERESSFQEICRRRVGTEIDSEMKSADEENREKIA